MKIIYNKWLPFGDYFAINLFGFMFVKADEGTPISAKTLNHEMIHTAQMKEMFYIGFYIWYFLEWLYQWVAQRFGVDVEPYFHVTMEQEAYDNDDNIDYLTTRKPFAWVKYIGSRNTY